MLAEVRVLHAGLVFLRDLHGVEGGTEENDFRLLIFHDNHLLSGAFPSQLAELVCKQAPVSLLTGRGGETYDGRSVGAGRASSTA